MKINRSGVFLLGLCYAAFGGHACADSQTRESGQSPSAQHEYHHEHAYDHDHEHEHEHEHEHVTMSDHLTVLGDVRLVHAWAAATRGDSALVFVEIENRGHEPATLSGGESARAERVDLVGFQLVDGKPAYQPLSRIEIAPGSTLTLAPRAVALRLRGLSAPLRQGEHFPLELHLDHGHAEVAVQVEPAGATQHSHAGHSH